MAYEFLAGCYDAFTADVHYARWADYLEKHFARSRLPIRTVLDLACGTGSLTRVLAERGYEMIGADLSQEMLAQEDVRPLGKALNQAFAGRGGGKKRKRGRNSAHVFMPEHGEAGSVRDH